MSQRFARILIAGHVPLLAVAAVLCLAAWQPAGRVEFDRSLENMFAQDDPVLVPYRSLKERFGGNEVVLAVYRDDKLLHPDGRGIERLAGVDSQLAGVPGVQGVMSLARFDRMLRNLGQAGIASPDSLPARQYRELFEGLTHNSAGNVAAIACLLEPKDTVAVSRRETVDGLRHVVENLPAGTSGGTIAGEPVMVVDGFRYVEQDGARLGVSTTILLAVTILACFRSLRWVLIPVAVVQLTLLATRAVLVWSGLRLSMVSSMLTAIVTVIGVATIVHVIVRFREARMQGSNPRDAFLQVATLLAAPIFWACTTDALGFLSLRASHVGPVRDFGLMMAIGSMMVMLCVALVVPGLTLIGELDRDPHKAWGERQLSLGLRRLVDWVERRPGSVAVLVVVLIVFSVVGTMRLAVETDFTRNFRPGSPVVTSYEFIENELGGAGVWDIVIPVPGAVDAAFLDRVRRLQTRLRQIRRTTPDGRTTELTKVVSLTDALDAGQSIRLLQFVPLSGRLAGMKLAMPLFYGAMLYEPEPDADPSEPVWFRIMLRARERQTAAEKDWLIDQVSTAVRAEFPASGDVPAGEATGFYVLLARLIDRMIADQWVCFGVAAAAIGLVMAIAFRSLQLGLAALIPNALPIVVVLGGMGWLNLRINMGAAMIAAVSMGLSVDSSIHYVIAFRRARARGRSLREALDEVHQAVGRAMVFSTLALIVGFSVLCISEFIPTIYFGALVSLAMLGGLMGNLVVLPMLLVVFAKMFSRRLAEPP